MEPTNDHYLAVLGKANIPVPLEIDTEYQAMFELGVTDISKSSKQDGTFNYKYKAQIVGEVQLIKGEQIILGKQKGTDSQNWRRLIEGRGYDYHEWMKWQFSQFEDLEAKYLRR